MTHPSGTRTAPSTTASDSRSMTISLPVPTPALTVVSKLPIPITALLRREAAIPVDLVVTNGSFAPQSPFDTHSCHDACRIVSNPVGASVTFSFVSCPGSLVNDLKHGGDRKRGFLFAAPTTAFLGRAQWSEELLVDPDLVPGLTTVEINWQCFTAKPTNPTARIVFQVSFVDDRTPPFIALPAGAQGFTMLSSSLSLVPSMALGSAQMQSTVLPHLGNCDGSPPPLLWIQRPFPPSHAIRNYFRVSVDYEGYVSSLVWCWSWLLFMLLHGVVAVVYGAFTRSLPYKALSRARFPGFWAIPLRFWIFQTMMSSACVLLWGGPAGAPPASAATKTIAGCSIVFVLATWLGYTALHRVYPGAPMDGITTLLIPCAADGDDAREGDDKTARTPLPQTSSSCGSRSLAFVHRVMLHQRVVHFVFGSHRWVDVDDAMRIKEAAAPTMDAEVGGVGSGEECSQPLRHERVTDPRPLNLFGPLFIALKANGLFFGPLDAMVSIAFGFVAAMPTARNNAANFVCWFRVAASFALSLLMFLVLVIVRPVLSTLLLSCLAIVYFLQLVASLCLFIALGQPGDMAASRAYEVLAELVGGVSVVATLVQLLFTILLSSWPYVALRQASAFQQRAFSWLRSMTNTSGRAATRRSPPLPSAGETAAERPWLLGHGAMDDLDGATAVEMSRQVAAPLPYVAPTIDGAPHSAMRTTSSTYTTDPHFDECYYDENPPHVVAAGAWRSCASRDAVDQGDFETFEMVSHAHSPLSDAFFAEPSLPIERSARLIDDASFHGAGPLFRRVTDTDAAVWLANRVSRRAAALVGSPTHSMKATSVTEASVANPLLTGSTVHARRYGDHVTWGGPSSSPTEAAPKPPPLLFHPRPLSLPPPFPSRVTPFVLPIDPDL